MNTAQTRSNDKDKFLQVLGRDTRSHGAVAVKERQRALAVRIGALA